MATGPGADQVSEAVDVVLRLLRPQAGRDWRVPAGQLDWTCHQTAAHIAHDLTKYAAQLAGRVEGRYLRFRLSVAEDVGATEVLAVLDACGRLLAGCVAAAPAEARAWHYGPSDAAGFAAMGIGELLVHAYDIASGLGLAWQPPSELAEVVVARLLGPSNGLDPAAHLLWATGRTVVSGRPVVKDWVWRAALS